MGYGPMALRVRLCWHWSGKVETSDEFGLRSSERLVVVNGGWRIATDDDRGHRGQNMRVHRMSVHDAGGIHRDRINLGSAFFRSGVESRHGDVRI